MAPRDLLNAGLPQTLFVANEVSVKHNKRRYTPYTKFLKYKIIEREERLLRYQVLTSGAARDK